MATVTTNATGKKKLVYKQDPDGVFRLKKLTDDDKLSTKSDKRTVDDYLNDLISCAYQVVDPNGPKAAADDVHLISEDAIPDGYEMTRMPSHEPSHELSSQAPAQAPAQPPHARQKSPGLKIDFGPGPHNTEHENERVSPITPMSPRTRHLPPGPGPGPSASANGPSAGPGPGPTAQIVERKGLHKFFQNLNTSLPIFHIPSFGLGLIIAVIITQMWPHLVYYTKIGFNYAKVGVVWGVVLGLVAWYAGVIKIQDVSSLRVFTEDLVTRITGKIKHPAGTAAVAPQHLPPAPQPHHLPPENLHEDISIRDYVDDEPSPPHHRYPDRRTQDRSRSMARVKTRQKSLSPSQSPKQSRKNTVTNVMPFKPQARTAPSASSVPINMDLESNYRSPSVPNLPTYERNHMPKLNRLHSTEPKSNYSRFVERSRKNSKHKNSGSVDSFDSSNLKYPPNPPGPLHHNAPLPQLPDEDLPFINEVRLVNHDQNQDLALEYGDHDTLAELPPQSYVGGVNRLNSTMSKKSVLGTRANYNRFLENALYLDQD